MQPAHFLARVALCASLAWLIIPRWADSGEPEAFPPSAAEQTVLVREARIRAQMLQEAVEGALQIMHRDFFDPDERDRIPSASLEDMFEVMAETWGVELHWLGVNAKTMDVDHEPHDEFEKNAVKALAAGAEEFEAVDEQVLRHVRPILLHNSCLKCHVPQRTSLESRVAGLAIRMPLRPQRASPAETAEEEKRGGSGEK